MTYFKLMGFGEGGWGPDMLKATAMTFEGTVRPGRVMLVRRVMESPAG